MGDRDLVSLAERASESLFRIPGVHSVAVGPKVTAGQRTNELSIRIFVREKRPLDEIPAEQRIPDEIDGVKTDVVEEGPATSFQLPGALTIRADPGNYRPLKGGVQIASAERLEAGTLGCFARVAGDPNTILGITCHHVVFKGVASPVSHDEVGQPLGDKGCSGCCSDIIGTVLDSICDTDVDIALVKLNAGVKWLADVLDIGATSDVAEVTDLDLLSLTPYQVRKRGRATRLTGGHVTDVGKIGSYELSDGSVRNYTGAIRIEGNPDPTAPSATTKFATKGDSGAAVINASGQIVGIVCGGMPPFYTVAVPIKTLVKKWTEDVVVQRRLAISIATATAPGKVQVVPMVGLAPAQEPVIPQADRERLDADVRRAPLLGWYLGLLQLHQQELTRLINTNRRVATAWHRSGAAELAQTLFRAFRHPNVSVPSEVRGRSLSACLDEALAALDRYGSPALKADSHAVAASIPDISGLTYREVIDLMAARPGPFPPRSVATDA